MKLHNLTIENFRGFDHFNLNHLGRVNLLVGTNNSGKSTVLEAAEILLSDQKLEAIWGILLRRGEIYEETDLSKNSRQLAIDIKCLFGNHLLNNGSKFYIDGNTDHGPCDTAFVAQKADDKKSLWTEHYLFDDDFPRRSLPSMQLSIISHQKHVKINPKILQSIPLNKVGGLSGKIYRRIRDELNWHLPETSRNSLIFVSAASLTSRKVVDLLNSVVLTPEETLVVDALRIIDEKIERIASIASEDGRSGSSSRGGVMVRITGKRARIPIGSMGDGIWRMLGLALAVVHSQNSILLIDEIDTGLHHTVMDKMWRFLDECSKRFNVQIIATTHSRDCYQSLAAICREGINDKSQSEITIQRIERNRSESVAYSEAMIIAAADNNVEVR